MSLPAGHNPEASMLQGGEGINIAPNQAGGGDSMLTGGEGVPILPSQAGGDPDTSAIQGVNFTDAEKDTLKQVAAFAYLKNKDRTDLSAKEITNLSIEAANETAKTLLNPTTDDISAYPDDKEKAYAINAVIAVQQDANRFNLEFPTDEEKSKALHAVAIESILRYRRANNLKIVEAHKVAKATKMTTPLLSEILALEKTLIYTEFYHITDINSTKELDKYRTIFQLKFIEMLDEVASQKMRINLSNDIERYKQQRILQWNQVYQTSNKKVNPIIPVIQPDANYNEKQILTMFSRYIYCLPDKLENVVIVPAINGDTDEFVNVLYRLEKIGALAYKKIGGKDRYKIKVGLTIVFMPSFYASITIGTPETIIKAKMSNLILFSTFIDINRTNPNQIFILSENTVSNYEIGLILSSAFTRSDVYKRYPLTMLEPSYVIYPYARSGIKNGFVISASTDSETSIPKLNNFNLNDLKTNKMYGKALGLAVKPDGSNSSESLDMFAIRSSKDEGGVQQRVRYDLNHPPGPCDGLLVSPLLHELTRESANEFSSDAFFLKPVYISKGTEVLKKEMALMVIKLNPNGDHAPLCTSALTSTASALSMDDMHISNKNADPNVDRVHIDIQGRVYSIREADSEVSTNWKKREFTQDEADFLNTTRLRPGVLQGVFGDNWPIDLANFLYTFTTSKCMSDNSLLTNRECSKCRSFLEEVNDYFIKHALRLDLGNSDFDEYAKEVYNEDVAPLVDIHKDHAKEANLSERTSHKQQFGTISSYDHTEPNGKKERRAFIIGINKKTFMHKYYVISVQSDLLETSRAADEKELERKVREELPIKYRDFIFIY
jgi:hypothetical protein